ncbi:hypothetical protein RJT34_30248 [Clitoria ternatea]|uniref:Uncharacterized protein n=1 Tax=Clitoria ternatea TaxID=43366 RepID=A0AAN9I080_CLITE
MHAGLPKDVHVNLRDIEEVEFQDGEEVSLETLKEKRVINPSGRERKRPLKVQITYCTINTRTGMEKFEKLRIDYERSHSEMRSDQKTRSNSLVKKLVKRPPANTSHEPVGTDFLQLLEMYCQLPIQCKVSSVKGLEKSESLSSPMTRSSAKKTKEVISKVVGLIVGPQGMPKPMEKLLKTYSHLTCTNLER